MNFLSTTHDAAIKWKHFPRYWPFVREVHRSPVSFPHKGQWRGALMFSLTCAEINSWVNNRKSGDLRHHRDYYDVTAMSLHNTSISLSLWILGHGYVITSIVLWGAMTQPTLIFDADPYKPPLRLGGWLHPSGSYWRDNLAMAYMICWFS